MALRIGGAGALPPQVTVGVRPEHVGPWADGGGLLGPFRGAAEAIEALGRETFVSVRISDALCYIVPFDGSARHQLSEELTFGIEPAGVQLFDPGSGASLGMGRSRPGGA